jgi:uncharacterized protein YaeQ
MALTSTLYTLDITLSHVDRHVYESLQLRVPMHPSESAEYFVARVLAYCLEYTEGIGFSRGISDPDEPTLFVRDLTGTLTAWFEIGAPDAARVHKAAKAAPRVAIYTHKDVAMVRRAFAGERIHRAETIAVHAFDRDLIVALAERLDRRLTLDVTVTDGTLWITVGGAVLTGTMTTWPLQDPA